MMIMRLYPVMGQVALEVCQVSNQEPPEGEPRSRLLHREYFEVADVAGPVFVSNAVYTALSTIEGYAQESIFDFLD